MTVEEVEETKRRGYRPMDRYVENNEIRAVLDLISEGVFSHGDPMLFRPIVDNLLMHDPYLVLADYASYAECQAKVADCWRDREGWTRMSILNAARMGKFSSDRSIREYMHTIWNTQPIPVVLEQ